jgi:predicted nucleic acid-binding protein
VLRVTADSNIYISAMNFGGAPDKLLDMARNGDIVLAISDPIVEEVTMSYATNSVGLMKRSNWLRPESTISRKKSIRGERSMS